MSHLLAAHVAEPPFVCVGVGAEQIGGDGVLQKGVAEHLKPLQVEAVAGVGQSQGLKDEAGVGAQVPGRVRSPGPGCEVRGRCCTSAV